MNPIRIFIADDHPIVINGLQLLLGSIPDFELVGSATDGAQALAYIAHNEVDVVLTDHHMPGLTGVELASRVHERGLRTRVVLLSMNEDPQCIRDALQVGAMGYLSKGVEKAELVRAIRAVCAGERYLSPPILQKLTDPDATGTDLLYVVNVTPLTRREIEILKLITNDLSNADIAEQLFISPATVETHRRNLMKKAGVSTAIGLMRWGLRHGLVEHE